MVGAALIGRKLRKVIGMRTVSENKEPQRVALNSDSMADEQAFLDCLKTNACQSWGDLYHIVNIIRREWSCCSSSTLISSREVFLFIKCFKYILEKDPDILKNKCIHGYLESEFPFDAYGDRPLSVRVEFYLEHAHEDHSGNRFGWCWDDVSKCLQYVLGYELGLSVNDLNYLSAFLIPVLFHRIERKKKINQVNQLLNTYKNKLPEGVYLFESVIADGKIVEISETRSLHQPGGYEGMSHSFGFWPFGSVPDSEVATLKMDEINSKHPFVSSIDSVPSPFIEKLEEHLKARVA